MKKFLIFTVTLFCAASAWSQPDAGPGMAQAPKTEVAPIANDPLDEDEIELSPEDIIAQLNHPAEKLELSSPENAVRSFVWALNNADLKTMRECVLNALPYEKLRALELLIQRSYRGYNLLISDFQAYPNGDKATVTLRLLNVLSLRNGQREITCERLHLVRNKDRWLILPDGKVPVEFDAVVAEDFLSAQAAITASAADVPFLSERAMLSACQTNLKQVTLAIVQFVQDENDKYALNADWQKQIALYTRNDFLFLCPAENEEKPSYSFNAELENKFANEVMDSSSTILVYEGQNKTFEFRHENKTLTNIAFADGHVKAYSRETLEAALKNATVRWKP